jgi:predicted unusual protein kinase regulating ubiquinone biosynthesis (AarF/ABC1/UbiB family)
MAELAALQDALPFYPNAVARELIRKELGAYPERVFDWMSTDPVAAASLGQVLTASTIRITVAILITSLYYCNYTDYITV